MISLGEARRHVLDRVPRRAPVDTPVGDALGLVLAEPVRATESVPPFDNTAMDGFAVHASDTVGAPVELEIVETIAAGHAPVVEVLPGQASRIFTGAPMPEGADAVVMVEKTEALDERTVRVDIEVPTGNHVRPAGDDLSIGQTVFEPGVVLTPGHLGVLNSLGVERVGRASIELEAWHHGGHGSPGIALVTPWHGKSTASPPPSPDPAESMFTPALGEFEA